MNKIIMYGFLAVILVSLVSAEEFYYNTSDFGNQSTYSGFLDKASEYTNHWYGTLFLLGFLIITYFSSRRYTLENKRALTVAFWSTTIVGILMIPLGIVKMEAILFIIVLFVGALVTLFW